MKDLISDNYEELFNNYCKFQDKHKLSNSKSCEDLFNDKILYFIETEISNPTKSMLTSFLKTKRKKEKQIKICEFKDVHTQTESEELICKIKYLFVDYRPKKNKK